MKQRTLAIVLILGCIALGAAAYYVRTKQDHTPPVITLEEGKIRYTEGEDEQVLVQGVSANDNIDGDLSDRVFVDRVVPIGENSAVVYYGVMDQHNNVGTAKRKIEYYAADKEDERQAGSNPKGEISEEGNSQEVSAGVEATHPDGDIPVIVLNTDQVTIPVRTQFEVLSVVQDVIDDVDDRDDLFQRISVDGEYNVNTAGTYELHYSVADSDGNVSEVKTLVLMVQ